jgi:hypothetical protein
MAAIGSSHDSCAEPWAFYVQSLAAAAGVVEVVDMPIALASSHTG